MARRSSSRTAAPTFQSLRRRSGAAGGPLAYYAFHLLYLDGYDLRAVPQIECKRLLKELFDKHGLSAPRCDEQSVSVERRKAASTAGH